jgi:osmotically-inducible protein OsmY
MTQVGTMAERTSWGRVRDMSDPRRGIVMVLVLCTGAVALAGCTGLIVGGAATTGVAVAQERSVGAAIGDTTIRLDINRRLFDESDTLFAGVSLEVVEGRVLLTGNVPTPEDRVTSVRLAWLAPGVKEVINEISINDRSGFIDYFKDVGITGRLRFELLRDGDIKDINYTIETQNAVVYLMGIAQDQSELDRVVNHARNIPGVKKVVSYAVLKDDPRRT